MLGPWRVDEVSAIPGGCRTARDCARVARGGACPVDHVTFAGPATLRAPVRDEQTDHSADRPDTTTWLRSPTIAIERRAERRAGVARSPSRSARPRSVSDAGERVAQVQG
jgi:hypothetical protein